MQSKKILGFWLVILLLFTMACKAETSNTTPPEQQSGNQQEQQLPQENQANQPSPADEKLTETPIEETPELNAPPQDLDFFQQVDLAKITVGGVLANSQDEDTFGQILTLQLTNPGTEEVIVTVPCGLVFTPSDEGNQRLMMVQPLEVALAAGETQSPTPYVVCIDLAAAAPSFNHTYSLGSLTDNPDLLKLAECICNKELSTDIGSFDGVGVQMAAWSVSVGGDFSQILEDEEATANMLGEEFGGSLDEALEGFMQMVSMFGDDWLNTCEIELESSD